MPTFLTIFRHSPENCPMFDEKARKALCEFWEKLPDLSMKHGVKVLGSCSVPAERIDLIMLEASSSDVLNSIWVETGVLALMAFETYEIKRPFSMEEAMKFLQQVMRVLK